MSKFPAIINPRSYVAKRELGTLVHVHFHHALAMVRTAYRAQSIQRFNTATLIAAYLTLYRHDGYKNGDDEKRTALSRMIPELIKRGVKFTKENINGEATPDTSRPLPSHREIVVVGAEAIFTEDTGSSTEGGA